VSGVLAGKVAFVTGASRGIGEAVALALAGEGAHVAVAARNVGPAEEVATRIRKMGREALALPLDVSDLEAVTEAGKRVVEALGPVGILVNNAGVNRDQLVVRMKAEEWSEVLRVNLDGAFHCTKVMARDMIKAREGRIINISSVIGTLGNPGQANYAASKAGLFGFTRSVARELAGRHITVNAVAPGYIRTAMTADLSEATREALLARIPLGRLGEPEDVAGLVVFLAGPAASYITGQVLVVDGGMVMA
jgi:3-oxoacyl-[acyl-carrier protein] reductase